MSAVSAVEFPLGVGGLNFMYANRLQYTLGILQAIICKHL